MHVSQFEIYRLAQRALEASGAPDGIDRDGGRAVAWLEARGLPGLRLLRASLAALERGFAGLRLKGGRIDAAGLPALAYAGAVADLARIRPSLVIANCRSPLLLLPAAASAAEAGTALSLCWDGLLWRVDAKREPSLYGMEDPEPRPDWLDPAPQEVEIRRAPPASGARLVLESRALARRHDRSLSRGIEVETEAWEAIGAVAARVQVPASAESRLKGAGGGDAND